MSQDAVRQRFLEINGVHPMTAEDDEYVTKQFRVLTDLCAEACREVAEVRQLMLDRKLPMPGYLRSDGAEMVSPDHFALADRLGIDNVRRWFVEQFGTAAEGNEEWDSYLSGRNVCLHSVTPATIKRKGQLLAAIDTATNPSELRKLSDELDELEPQFTAYDRLRFGGPLSRDTHITAVRARLGSHVGAADTVGED
jgi:hypothetical protein